METLFTGTSFSGHLLHSGNACPFLYCFCISIFSSSRQSIDRSWFTSVCVRCPRYPQLSEYGHFGVEGRGGAAAAALNSPFAAGARKFTEVDASQHLGRTKEPPIEEQNIGLFEVPEKKKVYNSDFDYIVQCAIAERYGGSVASSNSVLQGQVRYYRYRDRQTEKERRNKVSESTHNNNSSSSTSQDQELSPKKKAQQQADDELLLEEKRREAGGDIV